ncbi:cytochrome P450 [Cyathus striatus]|nr:cytochrome P450 [Cyathus striatus]
MFELNEREAFVLVAAAGLLVHLVFKHSETHEPVYVCILLLFVPLGLLHELPSQSASAFVNNAAYLGLYWASLLGSLLLYRVSPWHPLAKYPGPLICKLTKFRFALLSLKGKQYLEYTRLHERYGDIVRVGPNELSIRNVNAVAPLMGIDGLPKGPFWDGRIPENEAVRPLISIRNISEHARRRRSWRKAFNTSALKGYESFVARRCLQLIEKLGKESIPVDLAKWISYFSYDVMTDLAFGGGSDMIQNGDTEGTWQLIEAGQRNAIFMSHVPWLGMLFMKLPFFAKDLKAFREHAKLCAARRLRSSSNHKDIISYSVESDIAQCDKNKLLEVINDGGLAILAGSDTVSSVVTNLFYLLLCHPASFARLREEIDFFAIDCTDCARLTHLRYLNATINETLRLFPPVMSGSQRATEKGSEGYLCSEYFIPEGTAAFIPTYTLQRDVRYFSPFPNAFIPERWLPVEDQIHLEPGVFTNRVDFVLDTNAFIPFSVGAYNCVGMNFAWMEMRMVICHIVRGFDMTFAEGYCPSYWENGICDYYITLKGELPVVLVPRL